MSVIVSPNGPTTKPIDTVANKTVSTKMFQMPLPDPANGPRAELLLPKSTRMQLQKRFGFPVNTTRDMQQLVPNQTFYNANKDIVNAYSEIRNAQSVSKQTNQTGPKQQSSDKR